MSEKQESEVKHQAISASGLVERIKDEFTSRLRSQLQKKELSVSGLAKLSGISRSVLSEYLSDDPALPNAVNLVRLAQALDCEPGFFLTETSPSLQSGSVSDVMHLSNAMVDNDCMREILGKARDAQDSYIYYVPGTLPDPLKTDALFDFEYPSTTEQDLRPYIAAMRGMVGQALNGAMLIAEETLLDLYHLRGDYEGLPREVSEEQLHSLVVASRAHFPQWQIKVYRRRNFRIHPCFMVGKSLLIQEFFEYIIQMDSTSTILSVQADLNEVQRTAIDFLNWCEMNCPEFTGDDQFERTEIFKSGPDGR
ncbi:XRE family transcriptional regulator [Rhodobacteraceae bacterium 63075]|nr:XRE family transcriptional regulator [Rhodobacteraceae bacterium 63075]